MDFTKKTQRILSLCTGMRGIERGLERCGVNVRVQCFVEVEAFVIENLVQQMEQGVLDEAPIFSDIKSFDAAPFRGLVDGITGGYPCQPFSAAGQRKGADDPRHLWPFIKNIIKKSRPLWCFFENVEGHVSLGFESVQKELRQLGYQVEAGIFTAAEVGAPHKRSRLFILGMENSVLLGMRGWNDEQRANWKREIQTQGSSIMEDSEYATVRNKSGPVGWQVGEPDVRQRNREECSIRTRTTGELGNTEHNGFNGSENRKSFREGDNTNSDRQKSIIEFERSGGERSKNNEELADTNSSGGRENSEPSESRPESIEQSPVNSRRDYTRENEQEQVERWPARPGEDQYNWESPRLESSVGYAINGYNFREDLLRMAGNAVVEQTAELAFRTLIQKFT